MFFTRNRLVSVMLTAFITTNAAYAQSWSSQLNLSNSGRNTRAIQLLTFDRSNSNISATLAEQATNGFFTGLTPTGSYRINLSRKRIVTRGYTAEMLDEMLRITCLPPTVSLPTWRDLYCLTVKIEIRNLGDELIREVTKNDVYAVTSVHSRRGRISNWEIAIMSEIYSSLIRSARDELNNDATAINTRLISANQSFERIFNEFSANIRSGSSIVILVSGSDPAENNGISATLTRYFVNSDKNYTVRSFEGFGSHPMDQVGKVIEVSIIIAARLDTANNVRRLVLHAIDVETTQTIATSATILSRS